METEIRIPDLSPYAKGETEFTLETWHVPVGGEVEIGRPLMEVSTTKTIFDVDSMVSGRVIRHLVPAGTGGLTVGTPVAVMEVTGAAMMAMEMGAPESDDGAAPGAAGTPGNGAAAPDGGEAEPKG